MTTSGPPLTADHAEAYSQLVTCFNEHLDEIFEFEIVPSALQSASAGIMRDGSSYGASKRFLAAAFLHARQVFQSSLEVGKEREGVSLANDASKVMLLYDPEHVTAANFRKRYLRRAKDQELFRRELVFLTSILTSPLHRHAKSPTLWSHRAWVLQQTLPAMAVSDVESYFVKNMESELDAILRAGERHPTNYYAWGYARKLFRMMENLYLDKETYHWKPEIPLFVSSSAQRLKAWCMRHPSDTSGWSFLHDFLRLLTNEPRQAIVEDVLKYAVHLRLRNESLWVFVRIILADATLEKSRRDELNQLLGNLAFAETGKDERSEFTLCATRAIAWVNANQASM
ncbi:hypothetical protein P154DRAFT_98169 [Amniculicola lignicola CBS 123094]|uniref:Protein prenylyltransferase n=1 Tax=Amniculicola lignicola CBS 123094 TaxID=1392246 RepID=A0A6A5VUD4_9PLEO|nr:hypothetical protein P154DRAFT_98169 [Amniculicola lignicola CBS 123094]